MEKFNIGDEVFHKVIKRKGVVTDIINDILIEVKYDGDTYLWSRESVDHLEHISGFDGVGTVWLGDDWDREYMATPPKISKCVCDSRDLFHYGCRCGFFKKENKNEVQG